MRPMAARWFATAAGLLAALSLLVSAQGETLAQEPAFLGGLVVDEASLSPVGGATVTIEAAGIEAETREDGTFGFFEVPQGQISIRVSAEGRPTVVDEVEATSTAIAFARFVLPGIEAVLSELLAEATPRETYPADLTAAELVARELPGFQIVSSGVSPDSYYPRRLNLRGSSSLILSGEPLVFLDGVQIGSVGRALEQLALIPANDVENVTVLMGPAAAFLHAFAANGAILVETRGGP